MREIILKMSMTLDGFVASPDGGMKWFLDTRDPKGAKFTLNAISNAGLHIMGSRTFSDMSSYWPTSTDLFAATMNQIPKAVFSKRGAAILSGSNPTTTALKDARADNPSQQQNPLQPGADSWAKAYVATGDLKEEIAKLKAEDGKPIIAHGGARFARSLIASGLVDQYVMLVHPIAIGKGLPIFTDLSEPKSLELVSSTAFPRGGLGNIYRPK
jgi:dihydrofolate reductase